MINSTIRFLLNFQPVELSISDPNLTVLQYLREQLHLTGSKEGCGSGDCGACTVVLAEADGNRLRYQTVNSCITLVGSLHGKQLITVEHLRQNGQLHPVQQAMVDKDGSQCGFCTPGFVMSAFALHKQNPEPSREAVVEALAGNLCRCTGYRSIIDAAQTSCQSAAEDSFSTNTAQTIQQLKKINKAASQPVNQASLQYYAPSKIKDLAQYLLANPKATLVAGATDLALAITQQLQSFDQLVYLGNVTELKQIKVLKQKIKIGAAVSYSEFSPLLAEYYPELSQMIERIGSTQIRNSGTLGGNIGNASPIGDMPPALIALNARMTLRKGDEQREIAVEDFFKDYKVTDLAESEFIQDVSLAKPSEGQQLKVYKVSKRLDDDISAVLAAILLEIKDNTVANVSIAYGGMAAIPKRAVACEQVMSGKPWNQQTIDAAKQALSQDFQPMDDVRASAQYRMTVAKNLLQRCYFEWQNPTIETQVVNHA